MFRLRVHSDTISLRLDAEFYTPEHLQMQVALAKSGLPRKALGELVAKPINNSIRNTANALSSEVDSVPMFRPTDMVDGWLQLDDVLKIDSSFEEEHAKARVYPGDIVIGIAGSVGELGRVPPDIPYGNINGSCARVAPRADLGGYLYAYLCSTYGRRALLRLIVGAVQQHLNLEDLPGLPVALARSEEVWSYVGNKIRQAETLRQRGRHLVKLSRTLVEALIERRVSEKDVVSRLASGLAPPGHNQNGGLPQLGRQSSWVSSNHLMARFNAEAYSLEHLQDEEVVAASGLKVGRLDDLVTAPINNSIRDVTDAINSSDGEILMFRPADISGLWLDTTQTPRLPLSFEEQHEKSRVHPGDIVLAIAGTVGAAGRVPPFVTHANINGSSARLKVIPKFRGYLLVFLNTPIGQRVLSRWAVGAVQKHLNLVDIPDLLIPTPGDRVLKKLNDVIDQAEQAHWYARWLTTAARFLVEALIERKLTESDLIAAHKDPSADRALLERLTVDGLDVPEADPLFPDLEELEELLAEASKEDET